MATDIKKEIELEIAHVLFIDIVGYSKLLIDHQRRLLAELNSVVRGTEALRRAGRVSRLLLISRSAVASAASRTMASTSTGE